MFYVRCLWETRLVQASASDLSGEDRTLYAPVPLSAGFSAAALAQKACRGTFGEIPILPQEAYLSSHVQHTRLICKPFSTDSWFAILQHAGFHRSAVVYQCAHQSASGSWYQVQIMLPRCYVEGFQCALFLWRYSTRARDRP